nr:polymorphic toxin-type HINT domain-containing protein [Streptomyces physcomitrii]
MRIYFVAQVPDLADPGALDFMTKNSSIEDIKVGDKVLATDPETGRTVTRLIRTEADKKFNKLTLTTEDGTESLTATHEHPFWSPSEGDWVPASQLTRGMTLRTSNGTHATIKTNHPFTRHARTYNLTVENVHTYYVLAGATPVLVHNSGPCGISTRHEKAGDIGSWTGSTILATETESSSRVTARFLEGIIARMNSKEGSRTDVSTRILKYALMSTIRSSA